MSSLLRQLDGVAGVGSDVAALDGSAHDGPQDRVDTADRVRCALAGQLVTVAGVPASAANGAPALAAFLPGANSPNFTDLGRYRTLIPESELFNVTDAGELAVIAFSAA